MIKGKSIRRLSPSFLLKRGLGKPSSFQELDASLESLSGDLCEVLESRLIEKLPNHDLLR